MIRGYFASPVLGTSALAIYPEQYGNSSAINVKVDDVKVKRRRVIHDNSTFIKLCQQTNWHKIALNVFAKSRSFTKEEAKAHLTWRYEHSTRAY